MKTANSILLVRVPAEETVVGRELRDYILESLACGVLVLTEDATCEVMELPTLGGVEVKPAEEVPEPVPEPKTPTEAEEKREILQRLKDYRAAHGLGSLDAVSAKTAYFRDKRLTAEELRMILVGDGPPRPMADWRKISRALDALEKSEKGGVNPERRPE